MKFNCRDAQYILHKGSWFVSLKRSFPSAAKYVRFGWWDPLLHRLSVVVLATQPLFDSFMPSNASIVFAPTSFFNQRKNIACEDSVGRKRMAIQFEVNPVLSIGLF